MMDETGRSNILTLLLVFTQITGLRSTVPEVPEPCLLSVIPEGTIATMCKESSAVEELISGSLNNDSVVLRIITQQDHCICQLTLLNQTKDETLILRKHGRSKHAIPIDDTCGLAVDIHHISTGNHTAIDPIQCTNPKHITAITLAKNGMPQFQSRQIDGSFTRGYCMQILRRHSSSSHNPTISITCLEPERSEEKSELPTPKGDNKVADTPNATSTPTRLIPAQLTSTTSSVTGFEQDTEHTQNQPESQERDLTLYVSIGVGSGLGALFVLVLVVMIIVLKRKTSPASQTRAYDIPHVHEYSNKHVYDGLNDNIVSIPTQQHNITNENYINLDLRS